MAREIEMDVSIKPTMDNAAFRAINKRMEQLGGTIQSVQSGAHLRKGAAVATWAYGALKAGAFQNPTQAATALRTAAGGNVSSAANILINQNVIKGAQKLVNEQEAVLFKRLQGTAKRNDKLELELARHYQDVVRLGLAPTLDAARMAFVRSGEEKLSSQQAGWAMAASKRAGGIAKEETRERETQAAYIRLNALRQELVEGRASNMSRIVAGEPATVAANQTAKQLFAQINSTIKKIEKNTGRSDKTLTALRKNAKQLVSDTAPADSSQSNLMSTLGKLGLRALGVGSLVALAMKLGRWGIQQAERSIARGADAYTQSIVYGYGTGVVAQNRALASEYGVEESVLTDSTNYASGFRERMLYGRVSDREWIALSQMGEYGRYIMSGRGEENPAEANRLLQQYIASAGTSPRALARIRRQLGDLGLSPDIMKTTTHGVRKEEWEDTIARYTNIVNADKAAAIYNASIRRGVKPVEERLGGMAASLQKLAISDPAAYEKIISDMEASGISRDYIAQHLPMGRYGFIKNSGLDLAFSAADRLNNMVNVSSPMKASARIVSQALANQGIPAGVVVQIGSQYNYGDGADAVGKAAQNGSEEAWEKVNSRFKRLGVDATTYGQENTNTTYGRH